MSGEEVKRVLAANGVTQRDLAEKLGTTPQNISNLLAREDVRTGFLEDISKTTGIPLAAFFGDALTPKSVKPVPERKDEDGPHSVPLLPIFAQAGHLTGWSEGVEEVKCERVISPVGGVDMAVHIYGESMYPDIPNGSVVYVKKVQSILEWGRAFILDTIDGPLLKYLAPGSDAEHVKCISANHDPKYAPFEVQRGDILGIYKVVMCMRMM